MRILGYTYISAESRSFFNKLLFGCTSAETKRACFCSRFARKVISRAVIVAKLWRLLLRGRAVRDYGLGVQWGTSRLPPWCSISGSRSSSLFRGLRCRQVREQREPTDFNRVPIASVWAVSEPTSALKPIDASVALRPLIGLAFFH